MFAIFSSPHNRHARINTVAIFGFRINNPAFFIFNSKSPPMLCLTYYSYSAAQIRQISRICLFTWLPLSPGPSEKRFGAAQKQALYAMAYGACFSLLSFSPPGGQKPLFTLSRTDGRPDPPARPGRRPGHTAHTWAASPWTRGSWCADPRQRRPVPGA